MFLEIVRPFLTFLIALMTIVMGALALGLLPALVLIGYNKRYKMLTFWIILCLVCVAAAVYGLPKAMGDWQTYLGPRRFKPVPMYLGYFVGVLGACFVFPEPMRQARNRLRRPERNKNIWQDVDGNEFKRKRRRKKRRTNNYDA